MHQMLLYVLATVMHVLVLVQIIAVRQMLLYVLVTVTSVLAVVQHITVQQAMLYVQIPQPLVLVQAVAQCLIVRHVLTLMVYAAIQLVVVILVAKHMIMVLRVPLATLVAAARVLHMSQQEAPASIALRHTIVATEVAGALPLAQALPLIVAWATAHGV